MKVIVAIDQTANWKQVMEAVLKRHWPKDTTFKIITVVNAAPWGELDATKWDSTKRLISNKQCHDAENILNEARALLTNRILDCSVHVDLRKGSPRIEIIDAAIEWMADKIILGTHGHSPNRMFAGTVPHSVAKHAHCTVELVRLKEYANEIQKQKSASIA